MKMTWVYLALVMLLPALVVAQPMYRWVDKDGTVHYSDKAVEGAEPVELPGLTTYAEPDLPQRQAREDGQLAAPEPPFVYDEIEIVAPEHGSVVWVTGGIMTAVVRTEPALQPGHTIALMVNGAVAEGSPVAGYQIQVTGGMIRGEHQLVAAVLGPDGTALARSSPITIHALAHSIHSPQRRR